MNIESSLPYPERDSFLDELSTLDYLYCKRNDSEIDEIINKAFERWENENMGKLRGVRS